MYTLYVSAEENINWLMAYKCSCYIHSNALTDCVVTYYIVQVLHRMEQCLIYMVIQEESAILWEMIICVILSKKVHMNMGPILNGYRDMVKRIYGPSCEHEQQLHNK